MRRPGTGYRAFHPVRQARIVAAEQQSPFAEDVEQEGRGRAVQHLNVDREPRRAIQAQGQIEGPFEARVCHGGQMQADVDVVKAPAREERAVKPCPLHVRLRVERRREGAGHAASLAGVGAIQRPHDLQSTLPPGRLE